MIKIKPARNPKHIRPKYTNPKLVTILSRYICLAPQLNPNILWWVNWYIILYIGLVCICCSAACLSKCRYSHKIYVFTNCYYIIIMKILISALGLYARVCGACAVHMRAADGPKPNTAIALEVYKRDGWTSGWSIYWPLHTIHNKPISRETLRLRWNAFFQVN